MVTETAGSSALVWAGHWTSGHSFLLSRLPAGVAWSVWIYIGCRSEQHVELTVCLIVSWLGAGLDDICALQTSCSSSFPCLSNLDIGPVRHVCQPTRLHPCADRQPLNTLKQAGIKSHQPSTPMNHHASHRISLHFPASPRPVWTSYSATYTLKHRTLQGPSCPRHSWPPTETTTHVPACKVTCDS